jgi:hypothetical protein
VRRRARRWPAGMQFVEAAAPGHGTGVSTRRHRRAEPTAEKQYPPAVNHAATSANIPRGADGPRSLVSANQGRARHVACPRSRRRPVGSGPHEHLARWNS